MLVALLGCQREAPVANERPRPVRTVVVEPRASLQPLRLPGEVRPRVETRYGFRVGGKIAERMVSVGDPVKPGQVLARLDPRDLAPAVDKARSQMQAAATDLKLSNIELDRLKDLEGRGFVSRAQVDRQQAQTDANAARLRVARAQVNEADNAVAFQALVADVDGVVTSVDAEAGQVVSAGQPVVRVAKSGDKELLVNVPESELETARSAEGWEVSFAALGGAGFQARMRELSPVADAASRTYAMRLSLQGDTSAVALGMTGTAQAQRATESRIVLPLSALYSRDGTSGVWVVASDHTVRLVPVQTAGVHEDEVRISGGLSAGDRVVTAGANLLVAGQHVRLMDEATVK